MTPPVYAGYSAHGFEEMTHTLHHFCSRHVMPESLADKPLPVLYNSWYATTFQVQSEEQIKLARRAARIGVELFVVDDGWFDGRDDDTAALGDWYVDGKKFPGGLQELIQAVKEEGMKFGLWIEPEMTNPKSRLFEKHPDWIYQYDTRETLMGRNQYELDMFNPEVVEYLIEIFDRLLTENDISYIKWDMNRYAAEMGSRNRDKAQWKEMWFRNTQGIYRLIEELRRRHPQKYSYPDHGEIWSRPFQAEISENGVRLSCRSDLFGYEYEKNVFLQGERICMAYEIHNRNERPLPCIWTFHGLMRYEENMELLYGNDVQRFRNVFESRELGNVDEIYQRENGVYDFGKVPGARSRTMVKYYAEDRVKDGFCGYRYPSHRLECRYHYDPEKLPYLGVWISAGGFRGDYNCALEPANGYYDDIRIAHRNQSLYYLQKGKPLQFTLELEVCKY